ncbi:TraE/TraK family type IV conjugative transfer system protein (plasmid) [Aeromonas salmonicida subsp. salmonicida]|uniref:TraE/TraK family type IV conjugative transfer system protein n=1 Tax=Aeromonas salmonicida TaxID=645 RepID=UPI0023003832|nr:TraE/TraK family type IV conjugative transfer system protein [Aeromonas salmonicida]WCB52523.1 TraE/TraK family type IV conjugative transfer system protein [Aeromonas salmonicida subsp. salmonicida]
MVAIVIVALLLLLTLSLISTIFLVVQNRYLSTHREKIVTPMAYNAPFVISEANSSASHMQMMALSFMALRLNVSPATVDAQHDFLLGYVKSSAQPDFKLVLAKDAQQIKRNEVNSAFYQTRLLVFPAQNRIDVRGCLKPGLVMANPSLK